MMDLKTNLRKLLDTHHLNVLKLSNATKIPKSTLSDWLAGSHPNNLMQLKTVADYFDITVDQLVFDLSSAELKKSSELIPFGKYDVYLKKIE